MRKGDFSLIAVKPEKLSGYALFIENIPINAYYACFLASCSIRWFLAMTASIIA